MWLYELTHSFRPIFELYFTFEVHGETNLPRSGPGIVAANHSSFMDPWAMGIPLSRNVRHVINRRWYERSPVWRAIFDANGTVPLDASSPEGTLRTLGDALAKGALVGIFPEGKISDDGRLARFRPGIAFLAARTGVPVIPVGIRGAFDLLPRHRRWPRRGVIAIHIGEPMLYGPDRDPEDRRALLGFRDEVRAAVATLSGQPDA
jgi:1-acyl-sn-glycerol-3-phosphate acyltransferase